jgi:hypothetical protein
MKKKHWSIDIGTDAKICRTPCGMYIDGNEENENVLPVDKFELVDFGSRCTNCQKQYGWHKRHFPPVGSIRYIKWSRLYQYIYSIDYRRIGLNKWNPNKNGYPDYKQVSCGVYTFSKGLCRFREGKLFFYRHKNSTGGSSVSADDFHRPEFWGLPEETINYIKQFHKFMQI